jgi:hypothetical protein
LTIIQRYAIFLSILTYDDKAVLTNNGKLAAIMLNVDSENFERVFNLVNEAEKRVPVIHPAADAKERSEAYEKLMQFKRKKVPFGFDYKKELMEAVDERFNSVD